MSTILDDQALEQQLAARLRAKRESRGWTLADLAARSGVSRAMLSKIERGEASPTATLLGRLAAAFGLTLSQLFAGVGGESGGRVLRRRDQAIWRDPESGLLRRSLSPSGRAPLELVWIEFPPGGRVDYDASSYGMIADQQIVVVTGVLTLVSGEDRQTLGAGDCYRFGPPRAVTFRNDGAEPCVYLVAVLRQDR
jgi:transcriptional regulator with XRE-family HTH domain